MAHVEAVKPVWGTVAEYETPEKLIAAAQAATERGYTRMDAYTPFPVHGLPDAIGFEEYKVPWTVFLGGLAGGIAGFGLQAWVSAVAYPHNAGGKPLISWPAFIPVTFECTVLFAAFGAVFGMLGMNRLPKPYHPVFSAPHFERASQDLFFLCIEAQDPSYSSSEVQGFLEGTGARKVTEIVAEEEGNYS